MLYDTSAIIFLSTLSLRRATFTDRKRRAFVLHFYPRSPCGERRHRPIHHRLKYRFLSTLSLRRATRPRQIVIVIIDNFYPRSPCGERLLNPLKTFVILTFLSTLSLRRATEAPTTQDGKHAISIHALLAESDRRGHDFRGRICKGFLSTLSLRRATHTWKPH